MSSGIASDPRNSLSATRNSLSATKRDLVADYLREKILGGELHPGEALRQEELAEALGVSPTPVREALAQLEAEGILARQGAHRGVRVAEATLESIEETYTLRLALEPLALRLAKPHFTSEDLRTLRGLQAAMEVGDRKHDYANARALNYKTHTTIYRASKMPMLSRFISQLWARFPWDMLIVIPGRGHQSVFEHARLLELLEAGRWDEAEEFMRRHIMGGLESFRRYLGSKSSDPSGLTVSFMPDVGSLNKKGEPDR